MEPLPSLRQRHSRDLGASLADDDVAMTDVEAAAERRAERTAMAFLLDFKLRKLDGESYDKSRDPRKEQPA
jgi:hypothetical protein